MSTTLCPACKVLLAPTSLLLPTNCRITLISRTNQYSSATNAIVSYVSSPARYFPPTSSIPKTIDSRILQKVASTHRCVYVLVGLVLRLVVFVLDHNGRPFSRPPVLTRTPQIVGVQQNLVADSILNVSPMAGTICIPTERAETVVALQDLSLSTKKNPSNLSIHLAVYGVKLSTTCVNMREILPRQKCRT